MNTNKVNLQFIQKLYDELTSNLKTIKDDLPVLKKMEQGAKICKTYLKQISEYIVQNSFENIEDEIAYFKNLKPKFYAQWLFCSEVYKIEISKPLDDRETQSQFFKNRLDLIQSEFLQHADFYKYLRSDATDHDRFYFTRNQQSQSSNHFLHDDIHTDTTFYDKLVALYWANEKIVQYLNKRLQELDKPIEFVTQKTVPKLIWSEPRSALIELIYAFKTKGSFNYGNATVKEITDYLQEVFQIEITNPTRDFQDILRRKTGYSNYLDELKKSYLKYVESVEDKHFKR